MAAGLDATGLPLAWHVRMTGQSIMAMMRPLPGGLDKHFQEGFLDDMPYDVPNYLADYAMRMTHVPVGFCRCVNHTQNCFFKESFIDELAHAAGQDPYHYRRKMLRQHPRAARFVGVLDAAAAGAGWDTPPPPGVHRGTSGPKRSPESFTAASRSTRSMAPTTPPSSRYRSAAPRCASVAWSAPSTAGTWSTR